MAWRSKDGKNAGQKEKDPNDLNHKKSHDPSHYFHLYLIRRRLREPNCHTCININKAL
jgi:hypothetical protein